MCCGAAYAEAKRNCTQAMILSILSWSVPRSNSCLSLSLCPAVPFFPALAIMAALIGDHYVMSAQRKDELTDKSHTHAAKERRTRTPDSR